MTPIPKMLLPAMSHVPLNGLTVPPRVVLNLPPRMIYPVLLTLPDVPLRSLTVSLQQRILVLTHLNLHLGPTLVYPQQALIVPLPRPSLPQTPFLIQQSEVPPGLPPPVLPTRMKRCLGLLLSATQQPTRLTRTFRSRGNPINFRLRTLVFPPVLLTPAHVLVSPVNILFLLRQHLDVRYPLKTPPVSLQLPTVSVTKLVPHRHLLPNIEPGVAVEVLVVPLKSISVLIQPFRPHLARVLAVHPADTVVTLVPTLPLPDPPILNL